MTKSKIWYVWLTLTALAAGSIYPFTKILGQRITPLSLSFFRYFFAVLPMIPFFIIDLRKRKISVPGKDIVILSMLGLLGMTGFAFLFFYGVAYSTATNGSLLVNTQPIFATILAPLIIKEKFSVKELIGSLIGVIGIAFVLTGGKISSLSFSGSVLTGNILLVCASLSLTVYSILIKRFIGKYGSTISTFITITAGVVALTVIVYAVQGYIVDIPKIRGTDLLLLLYIGTAGTAALYIVFNKALEVVGVVKSIGFKLLIPIFGIILSIIIVRDRPSLFTYIGIALVIFAIVFIQLRSVKK